VCESISNDVEEGLHPGVQPGVGSVRVDLEDQVGLLLHDPAHVVEHEGVGGAGEVRDPRQVQVLDVLDLPDRLHVLLAVVPVVVRRDLGVVIEDHVEGYHRHALRGELAGDAHVGVTGEGVVGSPQQRDVDPVGVLLDLSEHLPAQLLVGGQEGLVALDADVVGAAALGAGEAELLGDVLEGRAAQLEAAAEGEQWPQHLLVSEPEGVAGEEGQALGERAHAGVHVLHGGHVAEVRQEDVVNALVHHVLDRAVGDLGGEAVVALLLGDPLGDHPGRLLDLHAQAVEEPGVEGPQ
jgi:hypothetical protein